MELFATDPSGYGLRLSRAIAEGMAPFRIKKTLLYYEFDIDHNRYEVMAVAVLMNGQEIGYPVLVEREDLISWPEGQIEKLAQQVTRVFRDRADYALPPLIHLGEN